MGVGKSTVGQIVAIKSGCDFIDLDTVIVERENKTIPEIFAEDGENYFRECEAKVLKSLLTSPPAVIATGGGVVLRKANRDFMRETGLIIYLKASWPVIKNRLSGSTDRPLVNPETGWVSVENRLAERQQYYADADYVIDTDMLSPEQCAAEILKIIGS